MYALTRVGTWICLFALSSSLTWADEAVRTRVDSIGNSWLGGRIETSAGARDGAAPNVWAQMYGYLQFIGRDYEAFGVATHSLGGDSTDNFFGLRVAGSQVVSSSNSSAILWEDANSLGIQTPRVPAFTLLGVINFELAVGGRAGYQGALCVTSDANRAFIFGSLRGWCQGSIEFGISVLGIGGGGVRATVRPIDIELKATFSAFRVGYGGRVWLESRGLRVQLELYGWVVLLGEASVTLVDETFGAWSYDLLNL